ncbi:LysR family transcriptional regulator [Yersinia kristensenii]|uniref:LysR family transcriptional regulator n=1 Tax=Yersinia kristensenii TaxID=28152 RepID=UPI003896A718
MISSERLNGIRAFVQAVDAGGFSRAAEQLGLSRSTVGKAVARLEERLSVRLFQRTTRSLSLTDEGRIFYADCVRALAALDAATTQLAARAVAPSGRLRISLPVLFGQQWVTPVLLTLADKYPALEIEALFSNQRVDFAEAGIDLAVRIGETGDAIGLTARKLGEQQQVLCGSTAYFTAYGYPQDWQELTEHRTIGQLQNGHNEPWRLWDNHGQVHWMSPVSRLRFDNLAAVATAALAGQGVALLPRWLVGDALRSGQLQEILPGSTGPGLPINVVWLKGGVMPARLRVAIDALVGAFTPHSPW